MEPAKEETTSQEISSSGKSQAMKETSFSGNSQSMVNQSDQSKEEPQTKSKYEETVAEIEMDLTYLSDFIGRGKQFILKRQIQMLAEGASSVTCLEYQRSVPEDMRMEFFFLLDTGAILKGYYSYHTREMSVERTDLVEEDVWQLQEEEKQRLEQEAKVKQEAEQKAAQEEAERKAEEEAKRKTEEESQNQVEPAEQEIETQEGGT